MGNWDDIQFNADTSSMDGHLRSSNAEPTTLRAAAGVPGVAGLPDDPVAGTRVRFEGKVAALLYYREPPPDGAEGTVVKTRTAMGDLTAHEGHVFVKWDGGAYGPVLARHLRLASTGTRTASGFRRVVAGLGDLGEFLKAGSGESLVHKATRDLWSLSRQGDQYVIERLFDDTGKPLKV